MRVLFKSMVLSVGLLVGSLVGCTTNSGGDKSIVDGTYTRPDQLETVMFGGYETSSFPALGKTIVISGNSLSIATVTGSNTKNYTYTLKDTVITLISADGKTVPVEEKSVQTGNGKADIKQAYFYRNNKIEIEYRLLIVESTKESYPVNGGYTCLAVYEITL
jgi:hypothetical protein